MPEGWVRDYWLVRKSLGSSPEAPHWEMCRKAADGQWNVLDEGSTAQGLMDHADLSDGIAN